MAEVTEPGPQREVQEIFIAQAEEGLGADAIKTRHILYSPDDDPSSAATLDADDPAWAAAEEEAQAAYDGSRRTPDLFDSIARAESDEGSAQGIDRLGRQAAVLRLRKRGSTRRSRPRSWRPGLEAGDLIKPVKSVVWLARDPGHVPPARSSTG